jgi:hypothetical protein
MPIKNTLWTIIKLTAKTEKYDDAATFTRF